MNWFHANCVGISDLDSVGAWVCVKCRQLPETVNTMKSHLEIILKSTKKIFETLDTLTENIELKFENLNDRLTAISKQQKLSDA